jgi:hypothetical protein
MVCNHTSCGNRRRAAFTLAEYLVATSIGLFVIAAALVLWAFATQTCASLFGYVELSSSSKNTLDLVSQQVRNAKRVVSCSATQLVIIDPDGSTNRLTYDAAQRKLVSYRGRTTSTLLQECTNFQFSVYQRTPIPGSYELFTNGWSTNTAKVVQMQWVCSRAVTGDRGAVESQISSKVVLRNQ